MTEFGFQDLLSMLVRGDVEFVLIGGLAGMAHGSARATVDVDVVYRRTPDNIDRLARCLQPHAPYLRAAGRPKDLEAIAELEALQEEKEN
jgi:hypothetical protein